MYFGYNPRSQWKFVYTFSDIWQQRNCSDGSNKMLCTESKSQSPTHSTGNLRIRSQILCVTAISEASTSMTEHRQVPPGLPQSRTTALPQKMPCSTFNLIKANQAELSPWLSSSHVQYSHLASESSTQSLPLHYRSLLRYLSKTRH